MPDTNNGWLLLLHQLPPKPDYLRVKTWRRLQKLGAVPLKNAAHALPVSSANQESFEWLAKQITAEAGMATVCEARMISGHTDRDIRALFLEARNEDYEAWSKVAKKDILRLKKTDQPQSILSKLEGALAEIRHKDFFGAPKGKEAEILIQKLKTEFTAEKTKNDALELIANPGSYKNRTWITRKGVQIDRIACSWLISRFIDPKAKIKFVDAKGYKAAEREIAFDMYEGEFTHIGEMCTFEVFVKRFLAKDKALNRLSEIIHDIDLEDGKFVRAESAGLAAMINGITRRSQIDEERIKIGSEILESLYASLTAPR